MKTDTSLVQRPALLMDVTDLLSDSPRLRCLDPDVVSDLSQREVGSCEERVPCPQTG